MNEPGALRTPRLWLTLTERINVTEGTKHAVRGLLCTPCNVALGAFQESEEMLNRAIRYLKATP